LFVNLIVGFFVIRTLVNGSVWWASSTIPSGTPIWSVIIVMAVVATLVETLVHKLDDNLLIPLFSGSAGQIVLFFMSVSFVY